MKDKQLKKFIEPHIRAMPVGECKYCDEHRDDQMMPYHSPSDYCESGKRPHCTCDVCY